MNIKSWTRDIVISAVGGILGSVVLAVLPIQVLASMGEPVGLGVFDLLVVQGVVLTAVFFGALLGVRRLFEWRRAQRKPNHGVPMAVVKNPPNNVIWGGFINKYGVQWRARYGDKRFGSKEAYIDGPFCPECGTELNTGEKTRFIRGRAEVWQCPDCGADYVRPAASYLDEEDNVKKVCESVVGQAERDGIEVVEDREDFYTTEWNRGGGMSYSRRRSY